MVKKKGKSKRITLKDKFKIQKRVVETHRKQRKQTKRDAKAGIHLNKKKKKDPGIPNSWPFKQDLLKEIQRTRERNAQLQAETKERKLAKIHHLQEMDISGTTTVQDLMDRAQRDSKEFQAKSKLQEEEGQNTNPSDKAGQASRRAYLRELKKVVDSADVLLQVLDARDPLGSRINASVENAILSRADKRMVLVLNKIDLVPKDVVRQWLATLRRSHPTIAIKASHDKTSSTTTVNEDSAIPVGMEGLLQLLKNYARTGASGASKKNKSTIVVGIIGYPNVGKSSIINALKRCRAVGVSPRPGFTTCMQEVVLDRHVRLLDSPGVVFNDGSAMLGNCVNADSMDDPITPVAALIKRCTQSSLVMTYNIPAFPPNDVMVFLAMVAKSLGRVKKGGIPDKVAAARAVLRDWNSGKIPFFTPPPPTATTAQNVNSASNKYSDAVIVSKLGQEFDVSKFDDAIMNSLKDSDEMDYVQLKQEPQNTAPVGNESSKEAIAFLTGAREGLESSDEDMEQTEEDDSINVDMDYDRKTAGSSKDNLADAEDYDFDDM